MRGVRFARLTTGVLLAVAVTAVISLTTAGASIKPLSTMCPISGPIAENLSGVAETSSSDVWAVGSCFNGNAPQTLVEHWNGTAWTQIPSPDPGGTADRNQLLSVVTLSASNVWAVGFYYKVSLSKTLVEHWNGTGWQHIASPNPGSSTGSALNGVAATSASNAWAVGDYCTGSPCSQQHTLILHWNGTTWSRVASPSPSCPNAINLSGVAATSASNAWAVGYCDTSTTSHVLILHWNGTTWSKVASPNLYCPNEINLTGVTAISSSRAWAVGNCGTSSGNKTVILRWNGTHWKRVASPNPGGSSNTSLTAVAASSSTNAWAVGDYGIGSLGATQTLILHWNGTTWAQVTSPNPGPSGSQNNILGVMALSPSEAWAVGFYQRVAAGSGYTLTEHWNGTAWNYMASP